MPRIPAVRTSSMACAISRLSWPRAMGELVNIIENEDRLEALRRTSLLDSPPEEAFDRLTRLATMILGVPVALFRCWTAIGFSSRVNAGFPSRSHPHDRYRWRTRSAGVAWERASP